MSQVKDIIDGIKHRLPDRVNIYPSLNRAVRLIAKRLMYHDSSFVRGALSVTVAEDGTSGALPSDFWGLAGKPYIYGKKRFLEPIPDQRYKLLYTTVSEPRYYELSGTTLNLYPGTSSEISIRGMYWARPAELDDPTDTMPYNELFDDVISEALIHIYGTGMTTGNTAELQMMTAMINQAVDEIVPYIDKQAPRIADDYLNLNYYEWDNG